MNYFVINLNSFWRILKSVNKIMIMYLVEMCKKVGKDNDVD